MNVEQIKEFRVFETKYRGDNPNFPCPREYVIEAWILSLKNPLKYFGVGILQIKKESRNLSLEILSFLEEWERNHSQKAFMRAMKNPKFKLAYEAGRRDGFWLQHTYPELDENWNQEQKDWYFAAYSVESRDRLARQN